MKGAEPEAQLPTPSAESGMVQARVHQFEAKTLKPNRAAGVTASSATLTNSAPSGVTASSATLTNDALMMARVTDLEAEVFKWQLKANESDRISLVAKHTMERKEAEVVQLERKAAEFRDRMHMSQKKCEAMRAEVKTSEMQAQEWRLESATKSCTILDLQEQLNESEDREAKMEQVLKQCEKDLAQCVCEKEQVQQAVQHLREQQPPTSNWHYLPSELPESDFSVDLSSF